MSSSGKVNAFGKATYDWSIHVWHWVYTCYFLSIKLKSVLKKKKNSSLINLFYDICKLHIIRLTRLFLIWNSTPNTKQMHQNYAGPWLQLLLCSLTGSLAGMSWHWHIACSIMKSSHFVPGAAFVFVWSKLFLNLYY